MGQFGYETLKSLRTLVPDATLDPYGVHYPAVKVDGDKFYNGVAEALHLGVAYDNSVRTGVADVIHQIETVHATCSSERFILSGYSQGAQVIGDAIQQMPASLRSLVVATSLFGNTEFNARDLTSNKSSWNHNYYGFLGPRQEGPGWSALIDTPVFDYCHDGDIFCGVSKRAQVGPFVVYYRDLDHIKDVENKLGNTTLFQEHESYLREGDTVAAAKDLAGVLGASAAPKTQTPSDTVFVIDSTGSMGGVIDSVRRNVQQLANSIAATSSSYRFALIDYKDDPDDDSAYQARVDVPFTSSVDSFQAGVNSIDADGGGDTPESMYSGIMAGLSLPWRDGVRKSVIVIGDAPGKDPEPVTGYTAQTVINKAFSVDPAQIYGVPTGGVDVENFMKTITDATGGTLTPSDGSSSFVDDLQSAISDSGTAPVVTLTGDTDAEAGTSTKLGASISNEDPSDPVVGYDWNFGTGTAAGSYDVTTTDPEAATTYTAAGSYTASVRARTRSGLSGLATTTVTVVPAPSAIPGAPIGLTATASDSSITLNFAAGPGVQPRFFIVRDGIGQIVDAFSPLDGSTTQTWIDSGLDGGTTRTYEVSAANSLGESPRVGPVSATTRVAEGTPTPAPTSTPTPTPTSTTPVPAPSPTDTATTPPSLPTSSDPGATTATSSPVDVNSTQTSTTAPVTAPSPVPGQTEPTPPATTTPGPVPHEAVKSTISIVGSKTVRAGSRVKIKGVGFVAGQRVSIRIGKSKRVIAHAVVHKNGSFTVTIRIPKKTHVRKLVITASSKSADASTKIKISKKRIPRRVL